jgi:hypothetical protein
VREEANSGDEGEWGDSLHVLREASKIGVGMPTLLYDPIRLVERG